MARPVRVATRGSALARRQAGRVIELLDVPAEYVIVSTRGDHPSMNSVPIHAMGGTGVFVKEVQHAVLTGDADLAVHSAKDLPSRTPDGLVLAAIPERADARDALVGCRFDELPAGGCVGTGSVRRRAQLAALRPDLGFGELRGNIPTRLEKAAAFDAAVLAAAGLDRLGLSERIAERLDPMLVLPQVGQGALAVECRAGDDEMCTLAASIDDLSAHAAVEAERAYLAELGGGCNLPCGALARVEGTGALTIEVMLAAIDGRIALRARVTGEVGDDPGALGVEAARRLLDEHGGRLLIGDPDSVASGGARGAPESTPTRKAGGTA